MIHTDMTEEELTIERMKITVRGWGTAREIHNRLCMRLLVYQCAYYCFQVSLISDRSYDIKERRLIDLERRWKITHEHSPARCVGSSIIESYPRCVQHETKRRVERYERRKAKQAAGRLSRFG